MLLVMIVPPQCPVLYLLYCPTVFIVLFVFIVFIVLSIVLLLCFPQVLHYILSIVHTAVGALCNIVLRPWRMLFCSTVYLYRTRMPTKSL